MTWRKRIKSLAPGLPLLTMAFLPVEDFEMWRRTVVVTLLMAAYYVMSRTGESQ